MSTVTERRNGIHWKAVVLLTVVWVLLWGELSVANVVFGLALGLVVNIVFPLPPISFHGRLRPLGVLHMGFRLVTDLVVSSIKVVAVVFQFGRTFENAVIRVPLRSHSDLYLTVTAELTCLVPGSVVLEARRSADTLYVHVMDVRGPEDLDAAREHTLAAERRVLRAFGSREEISCLREGRPIPRPDDPRTGRIEDAGEGTAAAAADDPFDPMEDTDGGQPAETQEAAGTSEEGREDS